MDNLISKKRISTYSSAITSVLLFAFLATMFGVSNVSGQGSLSPRGDITAVTPTPSMGLTGGATSG